MSFHRQRREEQSWANSKQDFWGISAKYLIVKLWKAFYKHAKPPGTWCMSYCFFLSTRRTGSSGSLRTQITHKLHQDLSGYIWSSTIRLSCACPTNLHSKRAGWRTLTGVSSCFGGQFPTMHKIRYKYACGLFFSQHDNMLSWWGRVYREE